MKKKVLKKRMQLLYPFLWNMIGMYTSQMRFPLIGFQSIHLEVKSHKNAIVTLEGIINAKDEVMFTVNRQGKIDFTLSKKFDNLLKKYYCGISHARIDAEKAIIHLTIKPLRLSRDVILYRKSCDRSSLQILN